MLDMRPPMQRDCQQNIARSKILAKLVRRRAGCFNRQAGSSNLFNERIMGMSSIASLSSAVQRLSRTQPELYSGLPMVVFMAARMSIVYRRQSCDGTSWRCAERRLAQQMFGFVLTLHTRMTNPLPCILLAVVVNVCMCACAKHHSKSLRQTLRQTPVKAVGGATAPSCTFQHALHHSMMATLLLRPRHSSWTHCWSGGCMSTNEQMGMPQ